VTEVESWNSSKSFHTPTAKPAANAAPKAVVSVMEGRTVWVKNKNKKTPS
jgi:hypothetical protein